MTPRPVIAATAALLMAACGQASSGSAGAGTPSQHAVATRLHFTGRLALDGDFRVSSAFSVQVTPTAAPVPAHGAVTACEQFARGFTHETAYGRTISFNSPPMETHGVTGTPGVYLTIDVNLGYAGPRVYSSGSTASLLGSAAITVVSSESSAVSVYHSTGASSTSLTVRPDGSGQVAFAGWRSDEVRGGIIAGHLGGEASWACG